MSPRKNITKKRGRCKKVKKCNQLKKKLFNSLLMNATESIGNKLLKTPGVSKMCSSVNPTIPSTLLGTESGMTHETSNSYKTEEIVCLGAKHVGTVNNNCTMKRKREADNSIEIVCEIIPKKTKLQQNTSGCEVNMHKSNLFDMCMPRVISNKQEMETLNIDDSALVCEIDDDDDDVIVIDDTTTAPIVSTTTENYKLCSSKGRNVFTVSNIIPHYNDTLLDFIPLENSTPKSNIIMQNINDECTTSKFCKRISKRSKRNAKGGKVRAQLHLTATNVNKKTVPSGIKVHPTSTPSPASEFGNNFYNPNHENINKSGLRPIIIDGSNVAMGHTSGKFFSWKGLIICINYFLKLGHLVRAFVPRFRKGACTSDLIQQVESFQDSGNVVFTPSRRVEGRLIISYDDRYIVQCAAELGGVIVSTDNYNDLLQENQSWKETIEKRLLMFTWIGDMLMFPQDPLGRFGPSLQEFLRFPNTKS